LLKLGFHDFIWGFSTVWPVDYDYCCNIWVRIYGMGFHRIDLGYLWSLIYRLKSRVHVGVLAELEMDFGSLVFDLFPLFWKLNGIIYIRDS
jgi:hypothetical protein